jgi:hypothetical protein
VERENPSTCVTVNWKVCKLAIVLYCLYLNVIKRECVINLIFLICIVGGGVHTGSTRHVSHSLAYCTCPG